MDTCYGDSGGPLVCPDGATSYLHGVTSWGFRCAEPELPRLYTRVSEYSDLINQILKGKYFYYLI